MNNGYAVSSSQGLRAGRAMPIKVLDLEMVLWREAQGTVHAWEDRCPHRGMRLSRGFVRGDQLGCLYHGWQYSGAGHCEKIPALPDFSPPDSICAKTYSSSEQSGIIWVSLGEEDSSPLPELHPSSKFCRSIYVRSAFELVRDRLLMAVFPLPTVRGGEPSHYQMLNTRIRDDQPTSKSYSVEWSLLGSNSPLPSTGTEPETEEHRDSAKNVSYESRLEGDNTIILSASAQGGVDETVCLLLQPVSEHETGIHVLYQADDSGGVSPTHFYANWIERVRWFFENRQEVRTANYRPWI